MSRSMLNRLGEECCSVISAMHQIVSTRFSLEGLYGFEGN